MRRTRLVESWLAALLTGACIAGLPACAVKHRESVNIERRPTPQQPDSAAAATGAPVPETRPVTMTPNTLQTTVAAIAADTTAARAALKRCGGRKLLPEQEGVFDGTTQLLIDVRRAMSGGDLPRAQSLARRAKQLAASIGCR